MLDRIRLGLEIHVQLNTQMKLFSSSENTPLEQPNSLINCLDIGTPGSLPVLNEEALQKAIIAGTHLNGDIQLHSTFDRKHYCYPDLPLGYQITQFYKPIIMNGFVEITNKKIRIHHIHLETDAGKLIHESDLTLLDYNRCGCPLIEIVTEPDFQSIEEVDEFIQKLAQILRYSNVSDCDMSKGNLRVDVNVSIDNMNGEFGTRVEIKNLNSFKSIRNAIECEYYRQKSSIENKETIVQETRLYDGEKNQTRSMRGKEDSIDYMYMADPNIPDIILTQEYVNNIIAHSPESFSVKEQKLSQHISNNEIKNSLLYNEKLMYLWENLKTPYLSVGANIITKYIPTINEDVPLNYLDDIITLLGDKKINASLVPTLLDIAIHSKSPLTYIEENNLLKTDNIDIIEQLLHELMIEFPNDWTRLKNGETKLIKFFLGKMMAKSSGSIDAQKAQEIIQKHL